MRTSFHHQPEAQHPKSSAIHKLPANYPIGGRYPMDCEPEMNIRPKSCTCRPRRMDHGQQGHNRTVGIPDFRACLEVRCGVGTSADRRIRRSRSEPGRGSRRKTLLRRGYHDLPGRYSGSPLSDLTMSYFSVDGLVSGIKSHMIEAPSKATAAILRNVVVWPKLAAIRPKTAVLRAAPIPDAVPMMP